MRSRDLLFSSVQFLFAVCLSLLGLAALGVASVPSLYEQCLFFLARGSSVLMAGGMILFVFGGLLLLLFCRMHRGQYFEVQLSSCKALATSSLIQESVLRYFASLHLSYPVDCEVLDVHKGRIFLSLVLPVLHRKERKELLAQLERELPFVLEQQLGYDKPLKLSILFRSYTFLKRSLEPRKEKEFRYQSCDKESNLVAPVKNF